MCYKEKEDEAEEGRPLPTVHDREKLSLQRLRAPYVAHEVGDSHLPGHDERDGTGEESERDEDSSKELEDSSHPLKGEQAIHPVAPHPSEQLLCPVLPEKESGNDPQGVQGRFLQASSPLEVQLNPFSPVSLLVVRLHFRGHSNVPEPTRHHRGPSNWLRERRTSTLAYKYVVRYH